MNRLIYIIACLSGLTFLTGCFQTPVFETDFNSKSLVKFGGSATLNPMSTTTKTTPFGVAGGPALIVSNCCSSCSECSSNESATRGIQITFANQTNSLGAFFHEKIASGATNHVLSGAIDFFVMAGTSTNIPTEQPSADDIRCMDDNQGEFRFVIRGRSGNDTNNSYFDLQFINPNTNCKCFLVGGHYVNYAQTPEPTQYPCLKPGQPYHLAVTFKTTSDDLTTMALWIKEGTGPITTCRTNAAYSLVQFQMDESQIPPSAFTNALYQNNKLDFGCLGTPTSPVPILYDRLRIWDKAPHCIPGL